MADFIAAAITFLLSNFPLTFFVIGLCVSLIAIARSPAPRDAAIIVEKLISWHVFFALGVTYLYNFVFHVFFGKMAATFIGRADSPLRSSACHATAPHAGELRQDQPSEESK